MGDPPVQNMGPPDAVLNGVRTARHLGNHAPGDNPLLNQLGHLMDPDLRDQRVLVVLIPEQAPDIGEQNQLLDRKSTRLNSSH